MPGRRVQPLQRNYILQKDEMLTCALYVALRRKEDLQKLAAVCQYMASTWDGIVIAKPQVLALPNWRLNMEEEML